MRQTLKKAMSAGFVLFLAGCVSTDTLEPGNPLSGIGLGAFGQSIALSWDPQSPAGRHLGSQRRIELIASYPSRGGLVQGERLAAAQVERGVNALRFILPDALQNVPTGPVCLRFSLPRGRSLPVRIARSGESSDGFYYREWEAKASLSSQLGELKIDQQRLTARLTQAEIVGDSFERWSADRNITQPAQCETLTATQTTARPATALTGPEKIRAARSHCVAQLNGLGSKLGLGAGSTPASVQFAAILNDVLRANHPQKATVQQMLSDANTFGQGQFILPAKDLPLTQTSIELLSKTRASIEPVLAGAIIDAYSSCRSETESQLEASHRQWLRQRSIEASGAQIEPIRQECRARFANEDNRRGAVMEMDAELERVEAEMSALSNSANANLPAQKPLVGEACPSSRAPI